jgi:hypothetical protein
MILLTFSLFPVSGMSQGISIENNSTESDSAATLFRDYLIRKEAIIDTKSTVLILKDYGINMSGSTLHGVGYNMANSIFKDFSKSIVFELKDTISGLGYDGLVLNTQVFVNQIKFYNYLRFNPTDLAANFQSLIDKYYPTFHLDSTWAYKVRNEKDEYAGEFKLEYKTLSREGCLVSDYSMISANDYYVIGRAHSCEAVYVFYQDAPKEFTVEYQFYGSVYEMYNRYNKLIHKGVISEYMRN